MIDIHRHLALARALQKQLAKFAEAAFVARIDADVPLRIQRGAKKELLRARKKAEFLRKLPLVHELIGDIEPIERARKGDARTHGVAVGAHMREDDRALQGAKNGCDLGDGIHEAS